jgi:glycosyltransferase involved in cell wall biosynthesis
MRARHKQVLVVIQGQRVTYRYRSFLLSLLAQRCENSMLRHADIVLANSRYTAELALQKGKGNPAVVIAPPGLEITPAESGTNNDKAWTATTLRLLFVGECAPRKGLTYLVQSLSKLRGVDFQLDIAGRYSRDDPYFKQIQQIITARQLDDRITWLGFVRHPQLRARLLDCDVFVCPSLSEGFGMAVAEAIACGRPIVAAKVGAIPELVDHGRNGLLVEPADPASLASAIDQLAKNPSLRRSMSRANAAKAPTLPTWDRFRQTLESQLAPAIEKLLSHDD